MPRVLTPAARGPGATACDGGRVAPPASTWSGYADGSIAAACAVRTIASVKSNEDVSACFHQVSKCRPETTCAGMRAS